MIDDNQSRQKSILSPADARQLSHGCDDTGDDANANGRAGNRRQSMSTPPDTLGLLAGTAGAGLWMGGCLWTGLGGILGGDPEIGQTVSTIGGALLFFGFARVLP